MERFIKLKEDMNAHALRDYPRECVGIITNDFIYVPCINTSPYPKDTFILDVGSGDGRDSFYLRKKAKQVLGVDLSNVVIKKNQLKSDGLLGSYFILKIGKKRVAEGYINYLHFIIACLL